MRVKIEAREAVAVLTNPRTMAGGRVEGGSALLPALAFCDRLGVLLWRAKYGEDLSQAKPAAVLLADWIRGAGRFNRWAAGRQQRRLRHARCAEHRAEATPADLADALARAVLGEWIADRCPQCHGRGTVGGEQYLGSKALLRCRACNAEGWRLLADGRTRETCAPCAGRGRVQAPAPDPGATRVCGLCKGCGRRRVEHGRRAAALGLSLDLYRRRWQPVFEALLARLDAVDESVDAGLREQMKPGTMRATLRTGPVPDAHRTAVSPPVGTLGQPAIEREERRRAE